MRLVSFVLGLALVSAGCAIQPGDPSGEPTQKPDEIVTTSGGSEGSPTALAPVAAEPTAGATHATGSSAAGHNGTQPTAAASTTPSQDNPNPSPWGNPTQGGVGLEPGSGGTK